MQHKLLPLTVLAISLLAAQAATAQNYPGRNDRNPDTSAQRGGPPQARPDGRQGEQRGNQGRGPERRDDGNRQYERRDDRNQQYDRRGGQPQARWDNDRGPRGAGPNHQYYRGDRMPQYYRSRMYVVDDWRGHRLSAPPRGYHWVQSGGDYVLVAIATGIILQLILNN